MNNKKTCSSKDIKTLPHGVVGAQAGWNAYITLVTVAYLVWRFFVILKRQG